PPDEALHFRGKTLTPESPRPLHIPEPANIPVLENQMDPVFNDTSTYERSVWPEQPAHGGWKKDGQGGLDGGLQQPENTVMNDNSADIYPSHSTGTGHGQGANAHSSFAPPIPLTPTRLRWSREIENAGKVEPPWVATKDDASSHTGVNFQTLLDNLSSVSAGGATVAASHLEGQSLHHAPKEVSQDLPARPLDPSLNPNYASHPYEQTPPAHATSAYATHPSNHAQHFTSSIAPGFAPGTDAGAGSLPLPLLPASSIPSLRGPQEALKKSRIDKQPVRTGKASDDDAPWGPEVQKKYDEFLHDERVYVTEGLWDRFPVGSRLFVGNLPTERVTKRDMFHLFHKYGKLAQISIKQAYGFIQFLEAGACHAALQVEQGALPQRSTRPGPTEAPRAPPSRRSRSPEFSRTGPARATARPPNDRFDRPSESSRPPFSDFRDEPTHRRRDDYRPPRSPRSPSPRPFRSGRDGYRSRDRTPERFDRRRRSRSPARHAPLVLLTLEIVGIAARARDLAGSMKGKLAYRSLGGPLEMCRRCRYLSWKKWTDVLVLGPRIPLGAAVHRQYVEGVLAVVRLSRPNQFSRKIPLQIFDRSAGPDSVRFSDYPEVDPNIAAEVMFHQAQAMQRGSIPTSYGLNPAFGVPPMQAMPLPQPGLPQPGLPTLSNAPSIANMISSLDGPSLHTLLSALQRPNPQSQPVSATQSPFSSPNPPPPADLASLLTNATRPPVLSNPQPLPHPHYNLHPPNAPVVSDPHLLSLLAKGLSGQQPQGQPVGSNVQNLMNHLAKWKQ
ncbi:uncharacterized protein N7477_000314, partial [Penicillium maclennaniae]|uniref:uncharacterized protein n=1 Tax=Penicillium maclennaniae TaxID=1343394 RepID=UPI00253FBD0D